ncbi:sensor domain-containing diguanylate cyclase [Peptococcaceae bacterium 1198_IL3148]
MNELFILIKNNEEWLINQVLNYAIKHNYVKYTSTLREAWRKSIADLSERILAVLQDNDLDLELNPDTDYTQDAIASYGIQQVQKHRERGVDTAMFLGLFKYYRQSYIDLILTAGFDREPENYYRLLINRFFDRIEIGLCTEGVNVPQSKVIRELQVNSRTMTNEKNKYLTIYESLPNPVILLDEKGRIDTMNHAAAELFYQDYCTPGVSYYGDESGMGTLPWLIDELREFIEIGTKELDFVKKLDTKRGALYFRIKLKPMLDISEKFIGTVVMLNNITSRKKAMDEIKRVNAELRQIFNTAASAMRVIDKNFNLLRINNTFANLAGLHPEEAVGKKCYQTLKSSFCGTAHCPLIRIINGEEKVEVDVEKERHDGVKIPCIVTAARFLAPDGELLGIVEDIRDISKRKRMEKQLEYISFHDSLTGIYNRSYFEQEMHCLEKGHCDPVGIIVCDVDGLKLVNDAWGHDAGDDLLTTAANVIKRASRKDDIVARIGGDEFVVLMPNSDYDTVKNSYDAIKAAIARYNATNPKLPLSISVGFAIKNGNAISLSDTFKKADQNMYWEKENHGKEARAVIKKIIRDFGND